MSSETTTKNGRLKNAGYILWKPWLPHVDVHLLLYFLYLYMHMLGLSTNVSACICKNACMCIIIIMMHSFSIVNIKQTIAIIIFVEIDQQNKIKPVSQHFYTRFLRNVCLSFSINQSIDRKTFSLVLVVLYHFHELFNLSFRTSPVFSSS